ncbi:hypothetical protein BCV70DRAFT_43144 [Testicularia cyperi]|uniref:Uncharacterized protein n=1 Tax=Testicularia cyperi TaxID=1882483 RepID=A0A317XKC9_9BASI|nr:hypothetical protein BCV70DRAFT_43144 [Testicularia cyperi]
MTSSPTRVFRHIATQHLRSHIAHCTLVPQGTRCKVEVREEEWGGGVVCRFQCCLICRIACYQIQTADNRRRRRDERRETADGKLTSCLHPCFFLFSVIVVALSFLSLSVCRSESDDTA